MKQPVQRSSGGTVAKLDLLQRRDRSLFVFEQKSWSDFRAWIASCVFHTVLFIVFALLWRPQSRGTAGDLDRPIGIAVAHQTSDGTEYALEGGSSGMTSAAVGSAQSIPMAIENESGPPISIESSLAKLLGNPASLPENGASDFQGKGLSGEGGLGTGTGKGTGKGPGTGKTKTTFFGVEGSGRSFVYVIDRSDSMNNYGSAPLRYAKQEVIKSLQSLTEFNQFQVVFYNDSLAPMSGAMLFAEDRNKRRATDFVRNMPGDGSTSHLPALKQGLAMRPEVLFFLTDAEDPSLSWEQLLDVQRRTELTGTTIHSIQFNVGPAANDGSWIRELAEMNRGTYKYVDVTTIQKLPSQ